MGACIECSCCVGWIGVGWSNTGGMVGSEAVVGFAGPGTPDEVYYDDDDDGDDGDESSILLLI